MPLRHLARTAGWCCDDLSFRGFLGLFGMFVFLARLLTARGAAWMVFGMSGASELRTAQGRGVGHQDVQLKRGPGTRGIVEFTTHDGRSFQVTDVLVRQGQAAHQVGDAVTVRHGAATPARAEIGGSSWLRAMARGVLHGHGAGRAAAVLSPRRWQCTCRMGGYMSNACITHTKRKQPSMTKQPPATELATSKRRCTKP